MPQVQAAIGRQLRAELEAPRSLPPELDALVTQLVQRSRVEGCGIVSAAAGNARARAR